MSLPNDVPVLVVGVIGLVLLTGGVVVGVVGDRGSTPGGDRSPGDARP